MLKSFFYKLYAKLSGKNHEATPEPVISAQLKERRPLPVGMAEFEEWSNRIISGTLLPADSESMKFALASMIMHLGPQESHKEDAFFIHSLRKSASNQIAHAKMQEIKEASAARQKTPVSVISLSEPAEA